MNSLPGQRQPLFCFVIDIVCKIAVESRINSQSKHTLQADLSEAPGPIHLGCSVLGLLLCCHSLSGGALVAKERSLWAWDCKSGEVCTARSPLHSGDASDSTGGVRTKAEEGRRALWSMQMWQGSYPVL